MADTFELLVPGQTCEAPLPLNPIKDQFVITRFAPLVASVRQPYAEASKLAPSAPLAAVVLPRDVIDPDDAKALLASTPVASLEAIKGGVPFVEEWAALSLPEPENPAGTEVEIKKLDAFLADPKITLKRTQHAVELTPAAVGGLLTEGLATVVVKVDEQPQLVLLKATPLPVSDESEGTVELEDVFAFLSNPQVELIPDGRVSVELKANNVAELTQTGTTQVTVNAGGQEKELYITGAKRGTATVEDPTPTLEGASVLEPLPSFELVLYLPYRQTWTLKGYSRGKLLNTISLAPQEETTIEIFSWARLKREREERLEAEIEGELEGTTSFTDSYETINEAAKDTGWTFTADGRVGVNILDVVALSGGVAGGTKENILTASRSTHETIKQSVDRAALRIRASRQTKVTETEELGSETRVTRLLRNANLCHTLNLDCFEVLATYDVTTQVIAEQVRVCVLTPNPISGQFSRQFLITHEASLRAALLSPIYAKGFDAARLLAAAESLCDAKRSIHCLESPIQSPAPGTGSSPALDSAREKVEKAARHVKEADERLRATADVKPLLDRLELRGFAAEFKGTGAQLAEALNRYHRALYLLLFLRAPADRGSRWLSALSDFSTANHFSPEAAQRLLRVVAGEATDVVNAPAHLSRYLFQLQELIASDLFQDVNFFTRQYLMNKIDLNDAGVYEAVSQLESHLSDYRAALAPPPTKADSASKVEQSWEAQIPPEFAPSRLAEATVNEGALLAHMAVNESHYRYAVWEATNPNDRQPFLKVLGALLGFVTNEPLGFVGKRAASPLRADASVRG